MPSVKTLDVRIFGADEVMEELAKGMSVTINMQPALEEVADDLMATIERTFHGQGRRGGGSWQQLSHGWEVYKAKRGYDPRILYSQHFLVRSWTERDDENQDLSVGRSVLRLDSLLDYAAIQQFGGGHLPARPYIDFSSADVARWVGICESHIYGAMSRL